MLNEAKIASVSERDFRAASGERRAASGEAASRESRVARARARRAKRETALLSYCISEARHSGDGVF